MGIYDELAKLDTPSSLPQNEDIKSKSVKISEDKQPIKNTKKQTSKKENKQTRKQDDNKTSKHVYMKTYTERKPSALATFRLAPTLIEKLEETQYIAKKEFKRKLTKYQLVTIALAHMFWDFETNGKACTVVELTESQDQ